jgi:hypothetical protein
VAAVLKGDMLKEFKKIMTWIKRMVKIFFKLHKRNKGERKGEDFMSGFKRERKGPGLRRMRG